MNTQDTIIRTQTNKYTTNIAYYYPNSFKGNPDNATESDIKKNIKVIDPNYRLGKKISNDDSYNMLFDLEGGKEAAILKVSPTYTGNGRLDSLSKLFISHAKKEADTLARIANDEYVGAILGAYVFCDNKGTERSVFIIERKYQSFAEYWNSESKSEIRICKVISDVLCDLNYIHSYYEIIHRDIKPGNLVVKKDIKGDHILLIDFNASREIDFYRKNSNLTYTGTSGFIAPEVVTGNYDHRADIYSLGVLAYYLFTDVLPIEYRMNNPGKSAAEVNMMIYEALQNAGASKPFADIIFKAISLQPEDRFNDAVEMNNEMIRKLTHLGSALPQKIERISYYYSEYPSGQLHWIGKATNTGLVITEIKQNEGGIEKQIIDIVNMYPDFLDAVKVKKAISISDKRFEDILYIQTMNKLKENTVFSLRIQNNKAEGYPLVFRRYDVITFDEEEKVVVLDSILFKGAEYVFVNEILPDESDVKDVYKIMRVFEDGTLETVKNPDLLKMIGPLFNEKLEKLQSY